MTVRSSNDQVRAALEKVWIDSRPEVLSRLATIESFLAALESGKSNHASRLAAQSAAHRLSGSLGMFGLDKASTCASEIESMLLHAEGSQVTKIAEFLRELRNMIERRESQDPGRIVHP